MKVKRNEDKMGQNRGELARNFPTDLRTEKMVSEILSRVTSM